MAKYRTKGTTIIELIVSTAVVAIIMATALLVWKGNNASARQCTKIINNINQNNALLDQLTRSIENLVCSDIVEPFTVEYHSDKVLIKIHTRHRIIENNQFENGPFITEFELDTKTGQLKLRQNPSLVFDSSFANIKDKWQIEKTNINNITIEKLIEKELFPIKITLNTNNENDNYYQMIVAK